MVLPMRYAEHRRETPNRSEGTNRLRGVVLHHTAGSYRGAVSWLCNPTTPASAHVVIARTGERTVLADDEAITWHAGASAWQAPGMTAPRKWCNAYTLGVELELTAAQYEAGTPFTHEQLLSLCQYLAPRARAHGWDSLGYVTHHRAVGIPAGRKVDLSDDHYTQCRLYLAALVFPQRGWKITPEALIETARIPEPPEAL